MSKIKDLPKYVRPREKALTYGIDSLSDSELLALLIGSGGKDNNVIDIANSLLSRYGDLYSLSTANQNDLLSVKGLGKVKVLELLTVFLLAKRINEYRLLNENKIVDSEYIFQKYRSKIGEKEQEYFTIIVLNKRKQIIYEHDLYIGEHNKVNISIKLIIKTVIMHNGYYFYLLHNHPSHSLFPSEMDCLSTKLLFEECKKVGIYLLDHLIITSSGYFSIINDKKKTKNVDIST